MPAHAIDCPVCFATLKLKAAPKPGSRLKCPKCDGIFSPEGDTGEISPIAEDEPDDVPARPTGRMAKPKKKKSKPFNWTPVVLGGGAVLMLLAIGIGLFLAKDFLLARMAAVDLAYCRFDKPSLLAELRPQEFLQAASVPQDVRNGSAFTQASAALKELIGVDFSDIELMQVQAAMPAGFNPMLRIAPVDQLVILTSKKPLVRPQIESTDVEGIKCYAVHGESPDSRSITTMFFANGNTAVFGSDSIVRGILSMWKAKTPPAPFAYKSTGATLVMFVGDDFVRDATSQLSNNPMLAMAGGQQPGGTGDPEIQKATDVIKTQAAGFSISIQCAADVSLNAAIHGRDAAGVQQLQAAVDGLRVKFQEPIKAFMAFAPPSQRDSFAMIEKVLATPVAVSGDRVTVAIPLTGSQQSEMLKSLVGTMPAMIAVKPGKGSAAAAPTTASPGITPPMMPADSSSTGQ